MSNQCKLCGNENIKIMHTGGYDADKWECSRCGIVYIAGGFNIDKSYYVKNFWRISAFCRKITQNRAPIEMIHENNIDEIIETIQPPVNFVDAKNRIIKFLGDNAECFGSWIDYDPDMDLEIIINNEDLKFLIKYLNENSLIEALNYHHDPFQNLFKLDKIMLTPTGWEVYEEINKLNSFSDYVFVAMWFDKKTLNLRNAIKSSIEASGYVPIIVDERHFTGNIMDYVISRIRESKFIIADFTVDKESSTDEKEKKGQIIKGGSRGGVYYEAGYARGLGLQVIHTCKNDILSKNRLHFDITQENTIFWSDSDVEDPTVRPLEKREEFTSPQNFAEKLYDRIISLFGSGNSKRQA